MSANQGFFVGTDPIASAGQFEPQTGGPFNNGSLNGTYSYGTDGAAIGSRLTAVGAVNFDGDKNDQAPEDDATPAGLAPNLPLSNTQYSFSSTSSPPGRGTLDAQGKTVAYIISPTKLVYINTPATKPRVVIVEK